MPEPKDKKSTAWQNDASTKAPSERKFTKIETNFVRLEPGNSVEGKVVSRDETKFPNGTVGRYVIATDKGDVTILGSVQLDDLMSKIEDGQYVRITLGGTTKTGGGRNLKNYTVEVADL